MCMCACALRLACAVGPPSQPKLHDAEASETLDQTDAKGLGQGSSTALALRLVVQDNPTWKGC
jgi:hypothetical protein